MKTLKYIIGAFVLAFGLNACVGDLDVTPIDPSMNTADKALQTEADYFALLAQCYTGFATSGSYGQTTSQESTAVSASISVDATTSTALPLTRLSAVGTTRLFRTSMVLHGLLQTCS